jgi:hypothetical protein
MAMARTRHKNTQAISLFPFLNILACVMGTLTLIIYGVALAHGGPMDEDALKARLYQRSRALESSIQRLEGQLTQDRSQVNRLEDQIESQREAPESLVVVPTGHTRGVIPSLVECTAESLIVLSSNSMSFDALLADLALQSDRSIVFLIRPSGIGTFEAAQKRIRESDVNYGYAPLPAAGRVDLSLWGIDQQQMNML